MNLPNVVQLHVVEPRSKAPEGVIVCMTIRAGTKNPYRICFPKTDVSGASALTAEEIIGQFDDHYEAGLMDHNGTIQEALQEVTLSLFDVCAAETIKNLLLAWPLLKNERKHWRTREEQVSYLLSCTNQWYQGQEVRVLLSDQITYEVNRKAI